MLSLVAAAASDPSRADTPMYYLRTFGRRGDAIAQLTWALALLSVAVVVIVSVLVLVGVLRRERFGPQANVRLPVERAGGRLGLRWIYVGLALTTVALAGSITWTMVTMAAIDEPPGEPKLTIEITGHQWWWQVRYLSDDPARQFETANEIHIPVGEPVRFRLESADVIHSFWVPALSGKTDLIPGQTNVTWLQGDRAGVYRGQCAEYCGKQHAHMAMRIFADPPEAFQAWWAEQLRPAPSPAGDLIAMGESRFILRCGACHSVRGTRAGGRIGPDLSHLMSRTTIAAGVLPNSAGYLSGWIASPQSLKPGTKMPNLDLSGSDLNAIRNYLLTLK